MLDALVQLLPFNETKSIQVLDLGCGTGMLSKKILTRFPNVKLTCLDIAQNMLEETKNRFKNYNQIQYICLDFAQFKPSQQYDAIVSSLALHHLETDLMKKTMYQKIFQTLTKGGVFFNADVVLGSNEYNQNQYMEKWTMFMEQNVPHTDVELKWLPKYYAEDIPAKMNDHIKWMEEIGFKEIDIIWKYFNFAVYGGYKK